MHLDDLIRYENEGSALDFKKTEYHRSKFDDLVKDVVSMANAAVTGSRLIIVGVDLSTDPRTFPGIGTLTDSATFQNLIHTKVEPEIDLKYYAYDFQGVKLGVFEIGGCDDPPYMLKADMATLKKGSCYIRKGSTQLPFMREDLDRIISRKLTNKSFKGDVDILFKNSGIANLQLKAVDMVRYPSDLEKEVIEHELNRVDRMDRIRRVIRGGMLNSLYSTSADRYLEMSDPELREKLQSVKRDFAEKDRYYIYEQCSHKLNFLIKNTGSEYIEDCTISIFVPKQPGLLIAEDRYYKASDLTANRHFDADYPKVEQDNTGYTIKIILKSIKHLDYVDLFEVDLRLTLLAELKGKTISFKFQITGKNLSSPLNKELEIDVN